MPRKSAAALSVIPLGLPERPKPPADLTKDQARIWQAIVAEQPVDYFFVGSQSLLAAYCRHVDTANTLARMINRTDPDQDFRLYAKLGEMAARETKAICALSLKLRLAPSHRYDNKKRIAVTATSRKPWEMSP